MNKSLLSRISLALGLFFCSPVLWAQAKADSLSPTIDETMRSHDKIYVVMTVCIVILVVLFLYLIRIDIKVSKKEKSL